MEESLNNIIKLERKLEKILPYIKDKKISTVVKWAKEDVDEMQRLKSELIKKELWDKANLIKEKTNYQINKKNDVERSLLEVYRIIGRELEEWRWIYLRLVT